MAEPTSMIAELRRRTGLGINTCKQALEEAHGDIELAIEQLRKKGAASAVKKAERETKEGKIECAESSLGLACVTVNSETDFVAKNEEFQNFAKEVAQIAAATAVTSVEALLAQKSSSHPGSSLEELRIQMVQKIGENIQIKRVDFFPAKNNLSQAVYSHQGGKLVTYVAIQGSSQVHDLAKDIAMHVAAAMPEYLNPEEIPATTIASEKEIAMAQIAGKPQNVQEKIIEGKLQAFYDQNCLTRQRYIRDDTLSIQQIVEARAKVLGSPLELIAFNRWTLA